MVAIQRRHRFDFASVEIHIEHGRARKPKMNNFLQQDGKNFFLPLGCIQTQRRRFTRGPLINGLLASASQRRTRHIPASIMGCGKDSELGKICDTLSALSSRDPPCHPISALSSRAEFRPPSCGGRNGVEGPAVSPTQKQVSHFATKARQVSQYCALNIYGYAAR